ncbi:enoyl-CoA hydratase/isomerase family protein [Streptomyces chartreusis]
MAEVSLVHRIEEGIAHLELNRPERGNAITLDMATALRELTQHCEQLVQQDQLRAILISGRGENFCYGGDLSAFRSVGEDLPAYLRETTRQFHGAIASLEYLPVPVVAAVQGAVAGGGLSLACVADIVLAASNARFTVAYGAVGLTPDGGASHTLTRLIGLRRALDLFFTNRTIDAAEAVSIGLINQVVEPADLIGNARSLAERLAISSHAYGAARRLFRESWNRDLVAHLEVESRALTSMAHRSESRARIAAFVNRQR